MNRNDFLLVKDYEGSEEIRESMERVSIYPVTGLLSEKEMSICRDWLLRQHYYEEKEFIQPKYISYEKMTEFIQMAADDIVRRLTEDEGFPKMF